MEKKTTTSNTRWKNKPILKTISDLILTKNNNRDKAAHLITGKQGENRAANYLKKKGYKLVEKNYRCKFGEIDIIALDGDILAFIEIKTRRSSENISPEFAVTKNKQGKIKRSALHYIGKHKIENRDCRFDIVTITIEKGSNEIVLYKDAFS